MKKKSKSKISQGGRKKTKKLKRRKGESIPKAFDAITQEPKMTKLWEESGLFDPEKYAEYLQGGKQGERQPVNTKIAQQKTADQKVAGQKTNYKGKKKKSIGGRNGAIKKPFVMTLPPPNANGDLHLGHTCGYSLQDAMGRYARLTGHPTLLLSGKDHASIQTEAVYVRKLQKKGIRKADLGREKFYKKCYEFCTTNADNARAQEKAIGLSADWGRELFTLDDRLTKVVYDTFFKLFKDGLVYRGKYIVNQCPYCGTALANIDTVHEERRGILARIIYPFVDKADQDLAEKTWRSRGGAEAEVRKSEPKVGIEIEVEPEMRTKIGEMKVEETDKWSTKGITIATTRPETMLGDTAVAVNPDDKRYKRFIGKKVRVPIVDRVVKIIADRSVDMSFGTGALKVTPAHAQVDFEMARQHDLEIINVINKEGKMESPTPDRFIGMETVECSKALITELNEMGLLVSIENIKHEVTQCERCDTVIQPIISNQWFVNVKPLAEKVLKTLDNGEVIVRPAWKQKALRHFLKNIHPWCISRQLWWGQRIPVWYSGGKELHDWLQNNEESTVWDYEKETNKEATGSGKVFAQVEKPKNDPEWEKMLKSRSVTSENVSAKTETVSGKKKEDGMRSLRLEHEKIDKTRPAEFEQEDDIFDTWFSSGQWPFSTLRAQFGDDYEKYYPTNVMETGKDILFWWVARMLMLGIYATGQVPFKDVYLHGMILAPDGSKMSKSRGNGVVPADIIAKYGADALRLWYYSDTLPGSDTPIREEKIKGSRNLVNKVWNAYRFVLMNLKEEEISELKDEMKNFEKVYRELGGGCGDEKDDTEKYGILIKTKESIQNVSRYIEKFQFNLAVEEIRRFFWHTICDQYIEDVKEGKYDMVQLLLAMIEYLKIMHPFIPFVTETVWQELRKMKLVDGLLAGALISDTK